MRTFVPVAFAAAIFCAGCDRGSTQAARNSEAAGKPPPAAPLAVKTVRPHRGEIARTVLLPGTVVAFQQATICAKVGGYLKNIAVDKGDEVKQGMLLAEIEVPELLADEAKYKAELELATIDWKRVQDAVKKAPDLVLAQTVDQARGKAEIAKANLERNETLLSYARIVAPFSGVVTRRMVDPGAFIPAATSGSAAQTAALLTLADLDKVRVQVAVPESEVKFIAAGTPMLFSVEGFQGRTFEGAITRVSFALDDATRTMLAEADVANPKRELRPGMFATVRLVAEKKTNALLLPAEAVLVEKAKTSVFTVEGGKAKKVGVKTGFADASTFEILDGITPETPVIVVGKLALSDGQPIQATP